jgi:hypothetical protein
MSIGAGFLLGLAITTSMLVFFMVLVSTIYFVSLRRWRLMPLFIIGLLAGLVPLFVYDAVSFGNPFLLPNLAGARVFSDTFFHVDPRNFGEKLLFYARSLVSYAPVFALGLFGMSYYPSAFKRQSAFLTIVGLIVVLAVYVLNINTTGDCQFGPRYMLPAMPFACLGIVGFSYLSSRFERRLAGIALALAGGISFIVNLVGAARGAMCCPDGRNAFSNHLAGIQQGEPRSYPLAFWLVVPLVISAVLFIWSVVSNRRAA